MEKVYESYESLKQSYEGILTEDDIRECFQNDQLIVDMKNTVNRSEKKYLIFWMAFLIGILIVLEMISDGPVILPIIKLLFSGWELLNKRYQTDIYKFKDKGKFLGSIIYFSKMKKFAKCHEGDDKMNTELINMAMDTGQQIISSPAVQR